MSDKQQDWKAGLEALLFAAGDPLPLTTLSQLLGIEAELLREELRELQQSWAADPTRGTYLCELEDSYTLRTKPEYSDLLRELYTPAAQAALTPAAYEALAIIAYNQPVTKAQVEAVRGVNSDSLVQRLQDRGLVEAQGRLEAPGRPVLYGTTRLFLEEFGISSLAALPPMELLMYSSLQDLEKNLQEATGAEAVRTQMTLDQLLTEQK